MSDVIKLVKQCNVVVCCTHMDTRARGDYMVLHNGADVGRLQHHHAPAQALDSDVSTLVLAKMTLLSVRYIYWTTGSPASEVVSGRGSDQGWRSRAHGSNLITNTAMGGATQARVSVCVFSASTPLIHHLVSRLSLDMQIVISFILTRR